MKILSVFDCAGVASLYSTQIKGSHVIQHRGLDPFEIGDFYNNTTFCKDINGVIEAAQDCYMDYDRIIINDMPDILPVFHDHNDVSIIYHGSRLRQNPDRCENKSAKRVFVMQEDLIPLKKECIFLPIPVDTNHFHPTDVDSYDTPLSISKTRLIPILEELTNGVIYHDRDKFPLKYRDMPSLLAKHRFYDDMRVDYSHPPKIIKSLSSTAYQALSMGKSVIDWNRDIITEFPEQHNLKNTARNLEACLE